MESFEALLLDEVQIDGELEAAGLCRRRFLDESEAWIEAVPVRD
jgi:hypothetical protein